MHTCHTSDLPKGSFTKTECIEQTLLFSIAANTNIMVIYDT
jgi:hypothetical protein